jgi:hypothetical protein
MSKPLDEFNLQITKDSGLISATQSNPTEDATNTTSEPDKIDLNQPETDQTNLAQPATTVVQATPEQITLYGWRKGKSAKGVPMLMRYPC